MLGVDLDLVGFPAATRYMRSPLAFSDVSVKPSFFRTTPAKKPRTECCCQPVAFMMAAMVAPCRPCSMAITAACFDSARPALAGLRGREPSRYVQKRKGCWIG